METLHTLFDIIMNIDVHLTAFISTYGTLTYAFLFAIIFSETAFIVFPFLPGDSLLFAAGSIAGSTQSLNPQLLFALLLLASILGNKLNYFLGKKIGPKVFTAQNSFLLNKKHLLEAKMFYERHGGKTIILARFIPIIRTFAPFVAGVGYMSLRQFSFYNALSAVLWIGSMLGAGYYLGQIPVVQAHFSIVIYSIIAVTLLPTIGVFLIQKIKQRVLRT